MKFEITCELTLARSVGGTYDTFGHVEIGITEEEEDEEDDDMKS